MTRTTRSVRSTAEKSGTAPAGSFTFRSSGTPVHPSRGLGGSERREGVRPEGGAPEAGNSHVSAVALVSASAAMGIRGPTSPNASRNKGSNRMHSSRVLGVVALAAIIVAAVSFAVVDVTITDGCGAGPCRAGIPIVAITFAALGGLAALVSVIPAVSWIVEAIQTARHAGLDDDEELARAARVRRPALSEDDV